MGRMEKTKTAYGTVVAAPEDVRTISVPFESRVRRVLVAVGQGVGKQDNLIDIEPSPDTVMQLRDARTTAQGAQNDLTLVEQKLELKLATKSDLVAVQQAAQLAQSKLESLEKRGIEQKKLASPLECCLVSKIDVLEGQIVPAGGTLVEVVPCDRIVVRLGVEPADVGELKVGMPVRLEAVQMAAGAQGQVALITRRINPGSRLVDVIVSPATNSPLMLETYVRGRIVVGAKDGLVVPRAAVLPEEEAQVLYTVADGKAVRHVVTIGLRDEKDYEITGNEIKEGDEVVVEGNYELEDGMAVEVAPPDDRAMTEPTH
jgi:RND family efflux transporter MFP subunit